MDESLSMPHGAKGLGVGWRQPVSTFIWLIGALWRGILAGKVFWLWVIWIVVLLTGMLYLPTLLPLLPIPWQETIIAPAIKDPVLVVAVWSAMVALAFVVLGDQSAIYAANVRPYGPIWGGLIGALLVVFLGCHTAGSVIDGQINAMTTARTKAEDALQRICDCDVAEGKQQGWTVLAGQRFVAVLDSLSQYERLRAANDPSGDDLAPARRALLNDLASAMPEMHYYIRKLHSAAADARSMLELALQYEGSVRTTDSQAALTPTGAMVEQAKRVLERGSVPLEQLLPAFDEARDELARLEREPNRRTFELHSIIANRLLAPTAELGTTAVAVRSSLAAINDRSRTTFNWIATFFATVVLFPWAVLLLFLLRKQQNRSAQIHLDLKRLGRVCLDRALADGLRAPAGRSSNLDDKEIRRLLAGRAFNVWEYLPNLALLTLLVGLGWFYVFYPQGMLGVALLIQSGAGFKEISTYLTTGMQPLTLVFIGAYLFVAQVLLRRYLADDLYPSVFCQANVRFIVVFLLGLAIMALLTPRAAEASLFLAFLTGFFPREGFRILTMASNALTRDLLSALKIGKLHQFFAEDLVAAPLTRLEGISIWIEARLLEENVENIAEMARAPIERLIVGTNFSTAQVVSWVDQAILHLHAGKDGCWIEPLRRAGVLTASDLLQKGGLNLANPSALCGKSWQPRAERIVHLAEAINTANQDQTGLTAKLISEICSALWPEQNMQYVLNFRASVAEEIRTRAATT